MKLNLLFLMSAVAAVFMGSLVSVFAEQAPTALQLVKAGNHFVSEPARDRVLEIFSEKSIGQLTPSLWTVAYYDVDTQFRVVEVKFGAGLKLEVNRPFRPFSRGKADDVLDLKAIKIDSDEAQKIALSQRILQPFTLKNTQLWLKRGDDGAVWKVRLWAAKLGKSTGVAEIGDIYLSAATGKIVRADLHIDRLN
jgi:hypothetical protein